MNARVVDAVHARGSGRSSPRAARTPRRGGACPAPRRRPGRRPRARTPSASRRRTRPGSSSRTRPATGSRRRPRRAPGTTAAGRASCASTIAASKRMTGNRRATSTIVWMTCSRTAAWREVELGGVVPREAGAVVAVVDVAPLARQPVAPLEHHGRVAVVPVVVLEADLDALVLGEVLAVERVAGVGRLGQREEPLGVLDHPARVDAHVVGHHVRGQPDAARPGPLPEVRPGAPRRRGRRRSGSRPASRPTRPRPGCRARS